MESGLKYQQQFSVNPFQLGLIGDLDEHNGTPGESDPEVYALAGAHGDASYANPGEILNPAYFLGLESNPGGLTVAWAEENTRAALFAALKRREVYATSGTVRLCASSALHICRPISVQPGAQPLMLPLKAIGRACRWVVH